MRGAAMRAFVLGEMQNYLTIFFKFPAKFNFGSILNSVFKKPSSKLNRNVWKFKRNSSPKTPLPKMLCSLAQGHKLYD
jgi:hypothetical protein